MGYVGDGDGPESKAIEVKEKAFQEEAAGLHKMILERTGSLFSVSEIGRLIQMPSKIHQYDTSGYTAEDMEFLQKIKKRVII
jgi:hypothetical protein